MRYAILIAAALLLTQTPSDHPPGIRGVWVDGTEGI